MEESIFRKKSLERISSPEELGETLHVTSPAVWMILIAVILVLAGMLIWSFSATIDSFAAGTAQVKDGTMRIEFQDQDLARHLGTGMKVTVGDTESTISSVGTGDDGAVFATASTNLSDGTYEAKIIFSQTQVLRLVFN